MANDTLISLFDSLREDSWRKEHPFSEDLKQAHELIHNPYAVDQDVEDGMVQWILKRQSCQFGRIAARKRQIHFCILRERDLADGEKGIAAKIAESRRLWKQRAVFNVQQPPHGFLLLFASPKVTMAAPDDNLRRFADRLLALAGWSPTRRGQLGNLISSDFLYLKCPTDSLFYGFQFNLDFFASAGDRRWWHDHRIPGGLAFTANSTGHMRHFKDWYEQPGTNHGEWAVKQAMFTIAQAHPTKASAENLPALDPQAEGRVTWLRSLSAQGHPLVSHISCPLRPVPVGLQGKDWTRYEGLLHTDHAVRAEFFDGREEAATGPTPYYMDFTYLYDKTQADFVKFMAGVRVSEEDVFKEIGRPETWATRAPVPLGSQRTTDQVGAINALLRVCYEWPLLSSYLDPDLSE